MAMQYVNHSDPTERQARMLRIQQSITSGGRLEEAQITPNTLFPELPLAERNMALLYVNHSDPMERQARILRLQQSMTPVGGLDRSLCAEVNKTLLKGKGLAMNNAMRSSSQGDRPELLGNGTDVWSKPLAVLAQKSRVVEEDEVSSASTPSVPVVFEMGSTLDNRSSGLQSKDKCWKKRAQRWKRLATKSGGDLVVIVPQPYQKRKLLQPMESR